MSRFTRAYNAALAAAEITRTAAASLAGMKQSVLSRLLNDERPVYAEHVEQMLKAIPARDREHCLRAFLIDQVPEQYRERLIVNFGALEEPPASFARHDPLSRDLHLLEREAERNPDLRKVLGNLASLVYHSSSGSVEEERAIRDVDELLERDASAAVGGSTKPAAIARAGSESSGIQPRPKPKSRG